MKQVGVREVQHHLARATAFRGVLVDETLTEMLVFFDADVATDP